MNTIVEMPIRSYRDLRVWKLSKQLSIHIYKTTQNFPKSEMYGLSNQMRRAAVSIPSNIAEGHARSTREYIRFIDIALGSLAELETQIEISMELDFLAPNTAESLLAEANHITNMLGKLSYSLKQKSPNPKSPIPNLEDV